MLNRKGQSLVLFVLLIPILLGIMGIVIDVGNALVLKGRMDNVILMVVEIAKTSSLDENKIQEMLDYNLEGSISKVVYHDGVLVIESSAKAYGVFSKLFGFDGFSVQSRYKEKISG